MERKGKFDESVLKMLFENGMASWIIQRSMGIEIAGEHAGTGSNFITSIVAIEEMAKVDGAVAALVDVRNTLVNSLILKVATDERKDKFLPKLAQNYAGSFCPSEPDAGSDGFSLKTEAKKDASDYAINGTKMRISDSDIAGVFLVFADGYRGVTAFIAERTTPGSSVAKPEEKLGIKDSRNVYRSLGVCQGAREQRTRRTWSRLQVRRGILELRELERSVSLRVASTQRYHTPSSECNLERISLAFSLRSIGLLE